ncbi:MAG: HlyD family efflux transporter periplasmic adaptor subunit [Planctomycetia bacterium]|nr:HlyD family efflux transporter periplasmic adaptor subunit [Planctomycetia bacterium]
MRRDLLGAVAGAVVLLGVGSWALRSFSGSSATAEVLTHRATTGVFSHDVVERGELESSANVSVRCEVQSRASGSNGVKIIEIVPEGTTVQKGDFLVKFDDAALQSERTTQLIQVSSAEAVAAQSTNDLEAAIIARKEYEFGEFETARETIRGEILVASENASRSADTLEFCQKLVRQGYMSEPKLRSSRFDLAKARSDLKIATTKLNALQEFTRAKKISELDAKVKTCESKLKSDEAKLSLEREKLKVLGDQIAKCLVTAPAAGQVVYDHERDQWGGAEFQIKVGTVIHEQRVVIRLPDPKQMQVVTKVAESRIDLIKAGMPATLEVEGMPGVELKGKVTKVNEYPAPEGWSNVKEYATMVQVIDPPPGLRPGMTAKVAIRVETIPSALQVPIQAVVERGGKHYCLVLRLGTTIEPREVLLGSTNEKFLVIRDGLASNDEVLMNPRVHLGSVQLPDYLLAKEPKIVTDQKPAQPAHMAAPGRVQAAVGGTGS